MPVYSTQELENLILTIGKEKGEEAFEEDTLSRDVFELRNLVDQSSAQLNQTEAGKKILTKLTELFPRLLQSALVLNQDNGDLSLRALLSEVELLFNQAGEYDAIKNKLDGIIKYYQGALKNWQSADEQRKQQLITPKAQLVLLNSSDHKFYYISQKLALKILCRDERGNPTEKTVGGVRNVVPLTTKDGKVVFLKADPVDLNHIDIRGEETWASFDVVMFGPETIAPTMAIKLSCVSVAPDQSKFSEMEVVNKIRQLPPGVKNVTLIERVAQASEGVKGILMSELLELIQSFNWLLKDIGEKELTKNWEFFVTNYIKPPDSLQQNNNPQNYPDLFLNFMESVKSVGKYKLPTDCQKFNLADDEGIKLFSRHIATYFRNSSAREMQIALKLMERYPQLMAEHTLDQIVQLPRLFQRITNLLPEHFNNASKVIATIPKLLNLVDIENYSRQFLLNIFKINSDAKPDNHMMTIEIVNGEVKKLKAVGFDNNEAGDRKYETQKSDQSTMPGLKSIFFSLPQLKQKIDEKTRKEFLAAKDDFIFKWLSYLYHQEQSYAQHIKNKTINEHDIYENGGKEPVLNFNFLFPPYFIPALERDIQLVVETIMNNPAATHEEVFNAVDPILARYYSVIDKKSSWLLYKVRIIYDELTKSLADINSLARDKLIDAVKVVVNNYFLATLPEIKNGILKEIESIDPKLQIDEFFAAIERILLRYYPHYASPADEQPYEAQLLLFGKDAPKMEVALKDSLEEQVIINGKNTAIKDGFKILAIGKNDPRVQKTDTVQTTIQKLVDSREILKELPGDDKAWKTLERIAIHFPFTTKLPATNLLNACWDRVIATDNDAIAKLLLQCGADANYRGSSHTLPPLFQAMKRQPKPALNVIDVLLASDKVDVNAEYNGQTALFFAVYIKNLELIRKLVASHKVNFERRIKIQVEGKEKTMTVMEYAMSLGNWEAFAALAELGAGLSLDGKAAVSFIKRHLKNPNDPNDPMNRAKAKLKQQNPMVEWEFLIDEWTIPLPAGVKPNPEDKNEDLFQGVLTGDRVLKPEFKEAINRLFNEKTGEPDKTNVHGLHTVPSLKIGGTTLFFKFNPNNPWVDLLYMYVSLLLFKMLVSVPLDLFRVVHKGKVYVVLVSLKGGEMELKDFVNNPQPHKNLNHVDPRFFAMDLFMAMFFRPRDGKVDNYFAALFINVFGILLWRFLAVDTEQMFGKPTKRDKETGHRVMDVKSYLFCLPQMLKELDPEVVAQILAHYPQDVLTEIFAFLQRYQIRRVEMFTVADTKRFQEQPIPNDVKLDVLFPKGSIATFYQVYMEIRRIYKTENPRAIDLLCKTTPVVGQMLRIMLQHSPDNAAQCYLNTYHPNRNNKKGEKDDKGVFVTNVMGRNVVGLETYTAAFKSNMVGVDHSKKKKNQPSVAIELSLEAARNELEILLKSGEQVSGVKEELLKGNIKPFMLLTNDSTCQLVINDMFPGSFVEDNNADKKTDSEKKGGGLSKFVGKIPGGLGKNSSDNERVERIVKVFKHRFISSINLAGMGISSAVLIRLIRNLPYLQDNLNLTGCDVTSLVLTVVTENCLTLKKLILGKSNLSAIGKVTDPVVFSTLQTFSVSDCKALTECNVAGADIRHITLDNLPNLTSLKLACRGLENLIITDCPMLPVEEIAKVVGQSPQLLNKILIALNKEACGEEPDEKPLDPNKLVKFNNIEELKKFFAQNPKVVAEFFRDIEWTPEFVKFLFIHSRTLLNILINSGQLGKFIQLCKLEKFVEIKVNGEKKPLVFERLNLCGAGNTISTSTVITLLQAPSFRKLDYTNYKKRTDTKTLEIPDKKSNIKHVAIAPNGDVYAVCVEGKAAIVCHWDITAVNGKRTDILAYDKPIKTLLFTPTGELVIADAGAITINKIGADKKLTLIKKIELAHTKNYIDTLLHMNNFLVIADKDNILIQPLDPTIPSKLLESRNHVSVLERWGYTQFLSGAEDGSITLWDYAEDTSLARIQVHGVRSKITALTGLSAELVASGSTDKTIKIVNVRERCVVLTLKGHGGAIKSLKLLQADNLLMSGDEDGEVKVWDLTSGDCVYSLPPHKDALTALAVLRDGRVLSASDDGTIRVVSFAKESIDFNNLTHAIKVEVTADKGELIIKYEVDKDEQAFVKTCEMLVFCVTGNNVKIIKDTKNCSITFSNIHVGKFDEIRKIFNAIKERVAHARKGEIKAEELKSDLRASVVKIPDSKSPPKSEIVSPVVMSPLKPVAWLSKATPSRQVQQGLLRSSQSPAGSSPVRQDSPLLSRQGSADGIVGVNPPSPTLSAKFFAAPASPASVGSPRLASSPSLLDSSSSSSSSSSLRSSSDGSPPKDLDSPPSSTKAAVLPVVVAPVAGSRLNMSSKLAHLPPPPPLPTTAIASITPVTPISSIATPVVTKPYFVVMGEGSGAPSLSGKGAIEVPKAPSPAVAKVFVPRAQPVVRAPNASEAREVPVVRPSMP